MYTSGLVLTLDSDPKKASDALLEIASAGPFALDDTTGRRRALVMETTDETSAHHWHDWIEALPGVASAEVVFVHWDNAETTHDAP